jgi:hypothetical protein
MRFQFSVPQFCNLEGTILPNTENPILEFGKIRGEHNPDPLYQNIYALKGLQ